MTIIGRELDSEKVYADEIDASEGRLDKIRAAKKLRKSQKGKDNTGTNDNAADDGDLELGGSSDQDFERRRRQSGSEEDEKEDGGGVTSTDFNAPGDAKATQQHQASSIAASDTSGKNTSNSSENEEPDIEKNEATNPTKVAKTDPNQDDDSANNVTTGMAVVDSKGKDVHKEESAPKTLALQEQEPIVQLSFYVAAVSFGLACIVALVMVILLATVGK